ncbi:hypothetical protein IVA79_31880 [Bradyrhizobium sp. 138]|uniref:hypothetical protein n=1 Tax=Bradyrhizobium sp. 138 TaxID=2782615 RepID=UPI001FFAA79D|nr:hypothetical protein [Bradyrhizobium sp. 138]MCK1738446.1 hypothetical protein [Bradyrhizobium sp. 138]
MSSTSRTNAPGAFDICVIATKPGLVCQWLLELVREEVAIMLGGQPFDDSASSLGIAKAGLLQDRTDYQVGLPLFGLPPRRAASSIASVALVKMISSVRQALTC